MNPGRNCLRVSFMVLCFIKGSETISGLFTVASPLPNHNWPVQLEVKLAKKTNEWTTHVNACLTPLNRGWSCSIFRLTCCNHGHNVSLQPPWGDWVSQLSRQLVTNLKFVSTTRSSIHRWGGKNVGVLAITSGSQCAVCRKNELIKE